MIGVIRIEIIDQTDAITTGANGETIGGIRRKIGTRKGSSGTTEETGLEVTSRRENELSGLRGHSDQTLIGNRIRVSGHRTVAGALAGPRRTKPEVSSRWSNTKS